LSRKSSIFSRLLGQFRYIWSAFAFARNGRLPSPPSSSSGSPADAVHRQPQPLGCFSFPATYSNGVHRGPRARRTSGCKEQVSLTEQRAQGPLVLSLWSSFVFRSLSLGLELQGRALFPPIGEPVSSGRCFRRGDLRGLRRIELVGDRDAPISRFHLGSADFFRSRRSWNRDAGSTAQRLKPKEVHEWWVDHAAPPTPARGGRPYVAAKRRCAGWTECEQLAPAVAVDTGTSACRLIPVDGPTTRRARPQIPRALGSHRLPCAMGPPRARAASTQEFLSSRYGRSGSYSKARP